MLVLVASHGLVSVATLPIDNPIQNFLIGEVPFHFDRQSYGTADGRVIRMAVDVVGDGNIMMRSPDPFQRRLWYSFIHTGCV